MKKITNLGEFAETFRTKKNLEQIEPDRLYRRIYFEFALAAWSELDANQRREVMEKATLSLRQQSILPEVW